MKLVVTYHYGTLYQKHNKEAEAHRIIDMWSQVVNLFKGRGYDKVFFGLYNEPQLVLQDWRLIKNLMMEKLRPKDPFRYWIVGSTNFNGIDAFVDLKKVPRDNKIIYTFHFYSPYIFTHQGAPWDPQKTALKNLPYPYSANLMPPRSSVPNTKDMVYNFEHYDQKANKDYLEQRILKVYNWILSNQAPVLCTELGTIASIPQPYRENYFKDVFSLFDKYGIPAILWDLDQSFTIIDANKVPLLSVSHWIQSRQ